MGSKSVLQISESADMFGKEIEARQLRIKVDPINLEANIKDILSTTIPFK